MTTPAGTLSKNTHLQVDLSLIPPPMSGPTRLPSAVPAAISAAIAGYFSFGTISYASSRAIETHPAAPMPWNARLIISCEMVCDAPQPPEKTTKTSMVAIVACFRPKISLNFAHMMIMLV